MSVSRPTAVYALLCSLAVAYCGVVWAQTSASMTGANLHRQVIDACSDDFRKLCPGGREADWRDVRTCLKFYRIDLTLRCRAMINASKP